MRSVFLVALLWSAAPVLSQVIYEPIRYQYGGDRSFYYGGHDPVILQRAYGSSEIARRFRREGRLVDSSLSGFVFVGSRGVPIYTDYYPWGDAAALGYTPADAFNEANAAEPTYFRKADLLPRARENRSVQPEIKAGVPAKGTITIKPYRKPATRPTTAPADPHAR